MVAVMRTYWTRVFDKAVELLQERPELTGDQAYEQARNWVDKNFELEA